MYSRISHCNENYTAILAYVRIEAACSEEERRLLKSAEIMLEHSAAHDATFERATGRATTCAVANTIALLTSSVHEYREDALRSLVPRVFESFSLS